MTERPFLHEGQMPLESSDFASDVPFESKDENDIGMRFLSLLL